MMARRTIALLVATGTLGAGCWDARVAVPLVAGAVVGAAVVSSVAPPAPRFVYAPPPRPGYVYQPGFWTWQDGGWLWIDGQWLAQRPDARWQPTHWEMMQDGRWQLISGRWVAY